MISRRLFLGGLLAGTAAPAIVRASSLMKIVVPESRIFRGEIGQIYGISFHSDPYQTPQELIKSAFNDPADQRRIGELMSEHLYAEANRAGHSHAIRRSLNMMAGIR